MVCLKKISELTSKQQITLGVVAVVLANTCMLASLALRHWAVGSWQVNLGFARLSIEFFEGFLIGFEIMIAAAGVVLLVLGNAASRKAATLAS